MKATLKERSARTIAINEIIKKCEIEPTQGDLNGAPQYDHSKVATLREDKGKDHAKPRDSEGIISSSSSHEESRNPSPVAIASVYQG